MKKVHVFVLMIILVTPQFLNAQTKIELHIGGAIPKGDFSNYNYDQAIFGNSGCADTGADLGIKLLKPSASMKNLSFTISADVMYNALSKQFTDKVVSSIREGIDNTSTTLSINHPSYTNLPILVGLNYSIPYDTKNEFYIDGGIGVNFISVSDMTVTAKFNGLSASETISVESSQSFAEQIGVGLLFEKKINIGINYNLLGTYEFNGKDKASNDTETKIQSINKMTVSTLNIYLGYRF